MRGTGSSVVEDPGEWAVGSDLFRLVVGVNVLRAEGLYICVVVCGGGCYDGVAGFDGELDGVSTDGSASSPDEHRRGAARSSLGQAETDEEGGVRDGDVDGQ